MVDKYVVNKRTVDDISESLKKIVSEFDEEMSKEMKASMDYCFLSTMIFKRWDHWGENIYYLSDFMEERFLNNEKTERSIALYVDELLGMAYRPHKVIEEEDELEEDCDIDWPEAFFPKDSKEIDDVYKYFASKLKSDEKLMSGFRLFTCSLMHDITKDFFGDADDQINEMRSRF